MLNTHMDTHAHAHAHIHMQEYKVFAEDLQEVGHIGVGNYGTVLKMLFKKTDTVMAVKVRQLVSLFSVCALPVCETGE